MVAVVQLVEHQVVILAVAGSSPVSHPDAQGPDLLVWALLSFTETTALSVPAPRRVDAGGQGVTQHRVTRS